MFEADLTEFALGNIPVIEALLDCRATLDQRDSSGATPLHFAAMNAKVDVVKLLLDRGAKPSKLIQVVCLVEICVCFFSCITCTRSYNPNFTHFRKLPHLSGFGFFGGNKNPRC